MTRKTHDIAVKTGEYTNSNGETKGRWQNVGALMEASDGGTFIILERWFNPAGIANPDNRGSVMLSCFEPKKDSRDAYRDKEPSGPMADDEIPF